MKRRSKIRLAAFASALFTAMLAWGISSTAMAAEYARQVSLTQQHALTELCEYLGNIETGLTKSLYVGSDDMLSVLTAAISRDTAGAKASLSALSTGDGQLVNTYRLLTQTGDYISALNRRAADGEEISEKERESLKKLLELITPLSSRFSFMAELMNSGHFSFDDVDDGMINSVRESEAPVSYFTAAGEAESEITDFPTLIYDGPFSDNMMNKSSVMLEEAPEISEKTAKSKVASILGVNEKLLYSTGSTDGKIASYVFMCDNSTVSVTKKGGYLASILTDARPGVKKLNGSDAVKLAGSFLEKAGYDNMVSSYYSEYDGVCTVNFACALGDYICYPDLIKVSVALDSGEITGFDASDYLMNHVRRTVPACLISPEEAAEDVAGTLTVKKTSFALIPLDTGKEAFTYELLCRSDDGRDVLVYKNVETGKEENILILLYADNGTLTR